jgi:hypothetical protein
MRNGEERGDRGSMDMDANELTGEMYLGRCKSGGGTAGIEEL